MPIEDKPDWVARACELAPMVEAAAGRTEAERKIPANVLAAMHDAGLFHILLPVSLGGAAADLVTFNQVIETIAAADASPAWCLAQAVASSHSAGFLDSTIARAEHLARDFWIEKSRGVRARHRLGEAPGRARIRRGDRLDHLVEGDEICLLYTSPSPRDS